MTKGTIPTPELNKLKKERPLTEAIQAFLEFMHEKGYELKKHIPTGWCAPDGSERISDEELDNRGLIRLGVFELVRFDLSTDLRVACTPEHWKACCRLWRDKERPAKDLKEELLRDLWHWDRGFELDDVGFHGHPLDKYLYEFIGVDPQKIDDERRMLLDRMQEVNDEGR